MYTPESPGSSGWDDPFALDQLVKDVANEVARKTDCYEDVRYLDIEEDVQVYCAPDIYRPVAVFAKDSSDVWNRLFVLRSHDDNFDSVRFDTAADPVTHVGFRGGNQLVLAPTPSTTRAAGVMIEGYCQPGEYWVYDEDGVAQTALVLLNKGDRAARFRIDELAQPGRWREALGGGTRLLAEGAAFEAEVPANGVQVYLFEQPVTAPALRTMMDAMAADRAFNRAVR
jgi:hypothetical protein